MTIVKAVLCELNDPITQQEVLKAIDTIKAGKAPGQDGLVPEIYKCLKFSLIPYFEVLFNSIFKTGKYPDAWSKAILKPVHKKGDRYNPTNYRGISLLDVIGKIFTRILNARLVLWAEKNNKFVEAQCGYRQNRSTFDNILV